MREHGYGKKVRACQSEHPTYRGDINAERMFLALRYDIYLN